jgi:RNase P subunit RPR2
LKRLQAAVARFEGHCAECGRSIARNAPIVYDTKLKRTLCKACGDFESAQAGELFAK